MDIRVVPRRAYGDTAADVFLALCGSFQRPVVGLATGNSPIPLYDELRQRVYDERADLSTIRAFAIDEYGGPPSHHCSNHAFFERYWHSIPNATTVHQFDPQAAELSVECARFAVALERAGGLDVAVLGIGLNGHLAFNEPGSARDSVARVMPLAPETQESAHICWQGDTPLYGLTLGLRELLAASRILLLAEGAAKADILHRALRGAVGPDCPASFLQEHPAVTLVADESAARVLSRS